MQNTMVLIHTLSNISRVRRGSKILCSAAQATTLEIQGKCSRTKSHRLRREIVIQCVRSKYFLKYYSERMGLNLDGKGGRWLTLVL